MEDRSVEAHYARDGGCADAQAGRGERGGRDGGDGCTSGFVSGAYAYAVAGYAGGTG